jgi:hypothetical protein
MQVSSMTMPGLSPTTAASSPAAERTEKSEHDGDGDDKTAGATSSPSQSVNLSGQVTGQLIHATA